VVRLLSGVFNVRTPFRMLAYTGSLLYICLIWGFCLTSSKQERIGCVMVRRALHECDRSWVQATE
jgi:hypothetical protein